MNQRVKYIIVIILLLGAGGILKAQDPHFTQMHRIPTWYNPAAAGHNVEHIRLTLLYRNQWASVASPFKTQGLFFDKQVSRVGFGVNLINNSAGASGFRQFYLNGQLSYRFEFGDNKIAGGLQLGFIQKSFDPSSMTFDDQYTPDQGFNPSNPTSETFSYTKVLRPDFGTGIFWTHGNRKYSKVLPFAGISLQHMNRPRESFLEQDNYVASRMTMQAGAGIQLNEHLVLTPAVMYATQQFARELMGSVMLKMPLAGRNNVETGIIYRNKDAVAAYAGYQWNSFMLGFSYDANISGLTGGAGAYEFTFTYIPKAKEKKEEKTKKKKPAVEVEKPKKEEESRKVPVTESKTVKAPVSVTPAATPEKKTAAKPVTTTPEPKAGIKTSPKPQPQPKPVTATAKPAAATPVVKPAAVEAISPASPVKPRPVQVAMPELKPVRPAASSKYTLPAPMAEPVAEPLAAPSPVKIVDSDADGIEDSRDGCPYMKGPAATNGCPDTDGDGIIDTKDKCPMEKGDAALSGCAVKKADATDITRGSQHFGNIEFKTGSTDVHGLYKLDIIEPALDSLFEKENYRLVITGHTDSEGDAPFNMVLSQARADVVKAIFIRKGLDESRITTVAYGENMPIEGNNTEEGRQRNRRVEVHIIK